MQGYKRERNKQRNNILLNGNERVWRNDALKTRNIREYISKNIKIMRAL